VEESNTTVLGQFSIKVKIGDAEIEVSAPEKDFVLDESNRLIEQFKLVPIASHTTNQAVDLNGATAHSAMSETRTMKPETLAEFFKQFASLQTNLDKMLAIGYWCEIKQHQPHFTIEDIQAKYKEIREPAPANITRDLNTLKSKGFLLPPEKSDDGVTYALSNSGIKEVESKMSQAPTKI
jgi:hypothetical protein